MARIVQKNAPRRAFHGFGFHFDHDDAGSPGTPHFGYFALSEQWYDGGLYSSSMLARQGENFSLTEASYVTYVNGNVPGVGNNGYGPPQWRYLGVGTYRCGGETFGIADGFPCAAGADGCKSQSRPGIGPLTPAFCIKGQGITPQRSYLPQIAMNQKLADDGGGFTLTAPASVVYALANPADVKDDQYIPATMIGMGLMSQAYYQAGNTPWPKAIHLPAGSYTCNEANFGAKPWYGAQMACFQLPDFAPIGGPPMTWYATEAEEYAAEQRAAAAEQAAQDAAAAQAALDAQKAAVAQAQAQADATLAQLKAAQDALAQQAAAQAAAEATRQVQQSAADAAAAQAAQAAMTAVASGNPADASTAANAAATAVAVQQAADTAASQVAAQAGATQTAQDAAVKESVNLANAQTALANAQQAYSQQAALASGAVSGSSLLGGLTTTQLLMYGGAALLLLLLLTGKSGPSVIYAAPAPAPAAK